MSLPTREEIADVLGNASDAIRAGVPTPIYWALIADALLARLRPAWEALCERARYEDDGLVLPLRNQIQELSKRLFTANTERDALRADLERCRAELAKTVPAGEQWRPIKGFEDRYEVSDLGRVRSLPRPRIPKARILTPMRNKDGYDHVMFRKGKKCHHFFIQRLVLESFVGPCPTGHEAAHQDGNPVNCALTNLRWATHLENAHQKNEHGTLYRKCPSCGERHKSGHCAALARPGVREALKA